MAKTLVDPRFNEHNNNKLKAASIVGHTDTESTRLWVHVSRPGNWTLIIWPEDNSSKDNPFPGNLRTLDNQSIDDYFNKNGIPNNQKLEHTFTDHEVTHTFDITRLKPDTKYYYALISDDKTLTLRAEIGYDKPRWFRTMAKDMDRFSFGFYSCHDPFNANNSEGAWALFKERLDRANARFVIGGGDQIYVDSQRKKWFPDIWEWLKENKEALIEKYKKSDDSIDKDGIREYLIDLYRWYYQVYWNFPHLQMIYARFPQYMIWDDHEIMDGWGSRTEAERLDLIARWLKQDDKETDKILVKQMWQAAYNAYFEFSHCHNPQTDIDLADSEKCQWDYSFTQGKTPFYVLDMRGHHDIERKSEDFRILGKAQLERFKSWLIIHTTTASNYLFVVLPVPIVHWSSFIVRNGTVIKTAKDDLQDEWEHGSNRHERDHLLDTIFSVLEVKGKTLVFLSGDVHAAAVFRLRHEKYRNAKIYQVTSSAISRMPAGELASLGIAGTGAMEGNANIHQENLFGHTGDKNFAIIHIGDDQIATVDLHWPGGTEGECVIKSILLD